MAIENPQDAIMKGMVLGSALMLCLKAMEKGGVCGAGISAATEAHQGLKGREVMLMVLVLDWLGLVKIDGLDIVLSPELVQAIRRTDEYQHHDREVVARVIEMALEKDALVRGEIMKALH